MAMKTRYNDQLRPFLSVYWLMGFLLAITAVQDGFAGVVNVFYEDFETTGLGRPAPTPVTGKPVATKSPSDGRWVKSAADTGFFYSDGLANQSPFPHSRLGGQFSGRLEHNRSIQAKFSPLDLNEPANISLDLWQRFNLNKSRSLTISGIDQDNAELFSLQLSRAGSVLLNGTEVDTVDKSDLEIFGDYRVHPNEAPEVKNQDVFWNRLDLSINPDGKINLKTVVTNTNGSAIESDVLANDGIFRIPTRMDSTYLTGLTLSTTNGGVTFVDNLMVTGALGVFCDFNDDASCDLADVNSFWGHWGTSDGIRDMNFDGTITKADMDDWMIQAGYLNSGEPYVYGNSDLDLDVDTRDLNHAIINFTGQGGDNKVFGNGNTDTDGDIDTADLTVAIMNFSGAVSPNASLHNQAVPEPTTLVLTLSAWLATVFLNGRRCF